MYYCLYQKLYLTPNLPPTPRSSRNSSSAVMEPTSPYTPSASVTGMPTPALPEKRVESSSPSTETMQSYPERSRMHQYHQGRLQPTWPRLWLRRCSHHQSAYDWSRRLRALQGPDARKGAVATMLCEYRFEH